MADAGIGRMEANSSAVTSHSENVGMVLRRWCTSECMRVVSGG